HLLRVEREERDAVLAVVADYDRLADGRLGLQQVLDLLRRDVLPARGLDEVLLPVGDAEEALRVELADVASVEPAAGIPALGRRLRAAVVAERDVRAARQYFAVLRDADLAAVQRQPDRSELEAVGPVAGEARGGLGETVAFEDENADRVEELRDLARQRRATRDHEAHVAAQQLVDAGEHQPIGERMLDVDERRHRTPLLLAAAALAADAHRPVE